MEDSEIPGSQPVCGFPRLIAAYHVLHRLPSPRHPPYALSSLTIKLALLEILPSGTPMALLVLFFYPSSDCQRTVRLIPEVKNSMKFLTSDTIWLAGRSPKAGGGKRI